MEIPFLPLITCDRQRCEWIGNDKSPSRLMSAAHLIYTALLVESQSVAVPKAHSKKFVAAWHWRGLIANIAVG
jgi:hypothetical protein